MSGMSVLTRWSRPVLAIGIVVCAARPANGATVVWGGGTGTFSTAANWVGGTAPASTDTVSFGGWAPLDRTAWAVTSSTNSAAASNASDGRRSTFWDTAA